MQRCHTDLNISSTPNICLIPIPFHCIQTSTSPADSIRAVCGIHNPHHFPSIYHLLPHLRPFAPYIYHCILSVRSGALNDLENRLISDLKQTLSPYLQTVIHRSSNGFHSLSTTHQQVDILWVFCGWSPFCRFSLFCFKSINQRTKVCYMKHADRWPKTFSTPLKW